MSITSQTHWSCRVVRTWSALVSSDDRRSATTSRHVAGCPDCQRYFAAVAELEASLRTAALMQFKAPPPGLESRIMREVEESALPRPRATRPTLFALVGAAAAMVLTFTVLVRHRVPPAEATTPVASVPSAAVVANSPAAVAATWTAPVTTLLKKDPLQNEIDSVYADAKSAARFLAINFLPGSPGETNNPNRRDG